MLILRKHERKLEFVNAIPFEEMKNRVRGHKPHEDWSELPPKFFGPRKNGGQKPVEFSIQALMRVIEQHKLQPVDGNYLITDEMVAEALAIDAAGAAQ